MKEVIRSADPRVAALIARQATQYAGDDHLGLERITRLLERLGRPQDRLPPVFHVAGTNGKGSTCAFLRAGLEAAGKRVHAFTSPHLVRYNERIRIAGRTWNALRVKNRVTALGGSGSGSEKERTLESTMWLAPGVGILKIQTGESVDLELLDVTRPARKKQPKAARPNQPKNTRPGN